MIREERNALVLLVAFLVAAGLLYTFVLRPALDEATGRPVVHAKPKPDPDEAETPAHPGDDLRPKAVRRMVSVHASLCDAATGTPITDAVAEVLYVADIADPTAQVEPNGRLSVDYLPPGVTFGLRVDAPGHRGRLFPRLRGEARSTIELGLVALDPIRAVRGEARAPNGAPAQNTLVTVFAAPPDRPSDSPLAFARRTAEALLSTPLASVRADAEGRFAIADLPAIPVVAYALCPPYASRAFSWVDLRHDDAALDFRFEHGDPARGRLSRAGAPVAGADVVLVGGDPADDEPSAAVTRSDAGGFFGHPALAAVPHFVFARGDGIVARGFGPVPFDPDREVRLELDEGQAITGSVRGPNREVVAAARVAARGEGDGALTIEATTGDDGGFRLAGLPIGSARVVVQADGFAPNRERVPVASFGAEHPVRLFSEAGASGVVVDEAGPVPGAIVDASPFARAVTDAAGWFSLAPLPPGPVELRARAEGRSAATLPVEVRLRDENRVRLVLSRGGQVHVRVKRTDGAAVSNARVAAVPLAGGWPAWPDAVRGRTDTAGQATLRGIRNGPCVLFAAHAGSAPVRTTPFTLDADRSRKGIALTFRPGGEIEGVTQDGDGVPLDAVRVTVLPVEADPLDAALLRFAGPAARSDETGTFLIGPLPAGSYRLAATRADRVGFVSEPVAVEDERRFVAHPLELAAGGCITGEVVDERRRPVPHAEVRFDVRLGDAAATEWSSGVVVTDAAGRFTLPRPPPSTLHLSARRRGSEVRLEVESGAGPFRIGFD